MKIVRRCRKIKSRFVGIASDFIIDKDILDKSYRVYGDEIPLPDYDFCMERSRYMFEKRSFNWSMYEICSWCAMRWELLYWRLHLKNNHNII